MIDNIFEGEKCKKDIRMAPLSSVLIKMIKMIDNIFEGEKCKKDIRMAPLSSVLIKMIDTVII